MRNSVGEVMTYLLPFREAVRIFLNNHCDIAIGEPIGADPFEECFDVTPQKDCVVPQPPVFSCDKLDNGIFNTRIRFITSH